MLLPYKMYTLLTYQECLSYYHIKTVLVISISRVSMLLPYQMSTFLAYQKCLLYYHKIKIAIKKCLPCYHIKCLGYYHMVSMLL